MELLILVAIIGFICWYMARQYAEGQEAGEKQAEARHQREITEARIPDWSTYAGQISGMRENEPTPGLFSLHVIGQPSAYTSVALKRALADNFADGVGRGRTIVYTISDASVTGLGFLVGQLEGFTRIEEWTGPEIPSEGIHEKHATRLQPKHKNQFVGDFLRRQVENDPAYKDVRFY